MVVFTEFPQELTDIYQTWKGQREPWMFKGKKAKQHYNNDVEKTGTEFTQEQLTNIENATNIPVTHNIQYALLNTKLAILTENKSSHRIIPVDKGQVWKDFAYTLDKAKQGVLFSSQAIRQNRKMVKSMLLFGIGTLAVLEDEYFEEGDFGLSIKAINQENLIFDPNAEDMDVNNMQGYWYEKEIIEYEVKKRFQKTIEYINSQRPDLNLTIENFLTTSTQVDENVQKVSSFKRKALLRYFYDKVESTMYYIDVPGGDLEKVFQENMLPEQFDLLKRFIVDEESNYFIRRTTCLGDYIVDVTVKPQTVYDIENFYNEWGDKIYESYGMLNWTMGAQEALNKFLQIMILNGILTNTPSWISPEDGISTKEKSNWENYGGDPRRIKFYKPKVIENQVLRPEREAAGQLSNFYPMVIEMLKSDMQFTTGINAVLRGDPQAAEIEVFSTLQTYQNASMQRILMLLSDFNFGMTMVGRIVIQKLLTNLRPNLNYTFFDEDNATVDIKFTRQMIKKAKLGKFKISAIPATLLQTQKNTIATEMFSVAKTTQDGIQKQILMNKGFELLGIKELDDMIDQTNVAKQLQGQIGNMQEQIKETQEVSKQLRNKTINAELKSEVYRKLNDIFTKLVKAEIEIEKDMQIKSLQDKIKELEKAPTEYT